MFDRYIRHSNIAVQLAMRRRPHQTSSTGRHLLLGLHSTHGRLSVSVWVVTDLSGIRTVRVRVGEGTTEAKIRAVSPRAVGCAHRAMLTRTSKTSTRVARALTAGGRPMTGVVVCD